MVKPEPQLIFSNLTLLFSTLLGIALFVLPFFAGEVPDVTAQLVVALAVLLVGLGAVGGSDLDAKGVALLAVLAALNGALRLLPNFQGASPIFFLLIVGGFVFGARFGFLLGALSLFVSAIVTGGFGPWLPYQMLGAAWVGASAGLLGHTLRRWRDNHPVELTALSIFGALWGLLFGALLNLWFWPTTADVSGLTGDGLARFAAIMQRFIIFYFSTSFGYDLWRAGFTVLLVLTLGGATLKIMRRFRRRFYFTQLTLLDKEADRATTNPI